MALAQWQGRLPYCGSIVFTVKNNFRQPIPFFNRIRIGMKGYINIPKTIYVKRCSECGARPIIALAGEAGYMVKCPANNAHYHTLPGLIDLEDWNQHNKTLSDNDYSLNSAQSI